MPGGVLHDLEQHRLRATDGRALVSVRNLCDELLGSQILPGMVAALLGSFREDVALAIEEKQRAT